MNKYTTFDISFKNNFDENVINSIINDGLILHFEYIYENQTINEIREYLIKIPKDTIRYVYIFVNDTSFSLYFFYNNGKLRIKLKRFGNPFQMRADYDECDQLVFDTPKYLEICLFLSQDLIVEKIKILENSEHEYEHEFSSMKNPIQNTISAVIGNTYFLKSPYQYMICFLNNIIENNGQIKNDYQYSDINDIAKYLAAQLVENTENGISIHFILNEQEFEVTVYPQNLTLRPLGVLQRQTLDNKEYVDVAYYIKIFMNLCRDLGIRDMETYFNQ